MNTQVLTVVAVLLLIAGAGAYWVTAGGARQPDQVQTTSQSQAPVTSGENPQEGGIHDMPVEPAAAAARKDLAARLGVAEKSIVILQIDEKSWSDGCLGLGGPAESCIQMLTDGFRVEMLAAGKTYVYRTDKTGAQVRAEAD